MKENDKIPQNQIKAPIVPNKEYIDALNKKQKQVTERPINLFNANTLKDKTVIIGSDELSGKVASSEKTNKSGWFKIVLFSLLVIVLLSVLLIFFLPEVQKPADINVAFDVDMEIHFDEIDPDTGEPIRYLFPGETLRATFVIQSTTAEENPGSIFIRMRAYGIIEQNYYSNLFWLEVYNDADWYHAADGFYYYKGILEPDNQIDAVKGITLRTDTVDSEFSGKTITIVLEAQALQADYHAIGDMWPTAPYTWAKQFE